MTEAKFTSFTAIFLMKLIWTSLLMQLENLLLYGLGNEK